MSNSRRLGKDASENSVGGNESFPISAFSNLSLFNLFSKDKLRKRDYEGPRRLPERSVLVSEMGMVSSIAMAEI